MSDLIEATHWSVHAWVDADLGDLRRTQRVVQLAHGLAPRPGAPLPEAGGRGARRTAASRFCTHEDIAPADIGQSPLVATARRLHAVPLVVAVHETTAATGTHL